jgi:hypothetical protein
MLRVFHDDAADQVFGEHPIEPGQHRHRFQMRRALDRSTASSRRSPRSCRSSSNRDIALSAPSRRPPCATQPVS